MSETFSKVEVITGVRPQTALHDRSEAGSRRRDAPAATKELSDAEKEAMFKQFLAWEVE
jgi:hypothetical protein